MALLRFEGMSICMSSVDMLTRLAIRRYANSGLLRRRGTDRTKDEKDKKPTVIIEYIRHPNAKTFRLATAKYVLKSIDVYTVSFG